MVVCQGQLDQWCRLEPAPCRGGGVQWTKRLRGHGHRKGGFAGIGHDAVLEDSLKLIRGIKRKKWTWRIARG